MKAKQLKSCAVREVEEETGVANIELIKLVGKTYHEYFDKWVGEDVIKETWWYLMQVKNISVLIPQTEEDIEQVIWANEQTVEKCLQNSYPNIVGIINRLQN